MDRNIRTSLFLLLFLYLPIVNSVLSVFPLDDQGYLLHAPYLSHTNARVSFARSMAILFVALYVLGVPFAVFWLVRKGQQRKSVVAEFVSCCYRPAYFFWDGVVLFRRVLMSCALAFITPSSVFLPIAIYSIYFLSEIAQHLAHPFRTAFDNNLEYYSLFSLVMFSPFIVGVFSAALPSWISLALVVVHVVLAVVFAGAVGIHAYRYRSEA